MKTQLKLVAGIAALSLVAVSSLTAQNTTKPVGYRTETLGANTFTFLAVDLADKIAAAGEVTAIAGTTITDGAADYSAAGNDETWLFRVTEGANAGLVTEVTTNPADGTQLTSADDVSTLVSVGDKYEIRAAQTISDVFGAANEAGLGEGTGSTADLVYVQTNEGLKKFFYQIGDGIFTTTGWKRTDTGDTDQAGQAIAYTDGIIVERKQATDLDLVIVGHVITTQTVVPVAGGTFNFLSRVFPVGATLGNSGMLAKEGALTAGTAATADLVYVNTAEGLKKFFFQIGDGIFTTDGIRATDTGDTDRSDVALSSQIIIERRAAEGINLPLTPPAFYGEL
jgi:uncharacterized protein (TIGR02597 family)